MEITNIDFSVLLNMVDTFYSNAWNRLIILLAIVGVSWPLILKAYSDYRVKIREEKLEKRLTEKIQNLNERNLELINKKTDENIEETDKFISTKLKKIDIKLSASRGLLWHVQGNISYEKKLYRAALEDFFAAFSCYFIGKDEGNLQTILTRIQDCYTRVKNLSILEEVENQHLNLIKRLNEINENARYSKTIRDIEEKYNSSKKKLKEVKN